MICIHKRDYIGRTYVFGDLSYSLPPRQDLGGRGRVGEWRIYIAVTTRQLIKYTVRDNVLTDSRNRKEIIMATSAFSIVGLAHKWLLAAEAQGCTPEVLNKMAEHPTLFGDARAVLEGGATIVPNKPLKKVAKAIASALLVLVTRVSVAATKESFFAAEKLVVNTEQDAKVKISGLWGNFETNFLGKVEPAFGGSELKVHKLLEKALDKPIIEELGGEAKAETTLTEMFSLMKVQGHGQEGPLLTNGWANIFYIRDVNGVLWAVGCYWFGLGWFCDAYSVDRPDDWLADNQVVSRNSATV